MKSSPGTPNFEMAIPASGAVGSSATNFEVVIPDSEAVGSDECVTLHFSLVDGTTVNLLDEMVASQSLLLLAGSGDKGQGKTISILIQMIITKFRYFFKFQS